MGHEAEHHYRLISYPGSHLEKLFVYRLSMIAYAEETMTIGS